MEGLTLIIGLAFAFGAGYFWGRQRARSQVLAQLRAMHFLTGEERELVRAFLITHGSGRD